MLWDSYIILKFQLLYLGQKTYSNVSLCCSQEKTQVNMVIIEITILFEYSDDKIDNIFFINYSRCKLAAVTDALEWIPRTETRQD